MDFLGIGPLELILVFIIILLVLGPNEMVKTGKTLGEIFRKVFRSDEWKGLNRILREIRTLPNRLTREAELDKLKQEIDLDRQISPIAGEMKGDTSQNLDAWTNPPKPTDISPESDETSTQSASQT
jgi:Sec-independent protein translocase protein TatA